MTLGAEWAENQELRAALLEALAMQRALEKVILAALAKATPPTKVTRPAVTMPTTTPTDAPWAKPTPWKPSGGTFGNP